MAGTFALLVAAFLVIDAIDRQVGEAAIERVRAAGDPVTPQELQEFYASSAAIEQATQHWNRAFVDSAEWKAKVLAMPIVGNNKTPELDERSFYSPVAVAKYGPFLDGPAATKLRETRLAREAGAVGRFPQSLDESDVEASTTHYQGLRTLQALLGLQRQIQESERNFDGASDTLLDLVAVSEALKNEPIGTSFLIRCGLLNVAAGEAMESMARCPYSEERLREIQRAFERQDLHAHLLHAMRGEQALVLQMYDPSIAGDPELERIRNLPFRGGDRAKAVEWFQTYLRGAEGGWATMAQATDDANAIMEEIDASGYIAYRYAVAMQRMHYPSMSLASAQRTQTSTNVAVAFAACRRYRLANGDWPESLEALVPDYLSAVPIDPNTVQPLVYERDGDTIRFRTQAYTKEAGYAKISYLDPTGRHVFDADAFEKTE